MAYSINADFCSSCGACLDVCPNEAILEKGSSFIIDQQKCKECRGTSASPQCAKVCPADACHPA